MADENLRGPRLTPSERALFTQRRKEAYEALHPETRNGTNQHSRLRQLGEPSDRFTSDTASRTGQSERAVQRGYPTNYQAGRLTLHRVKGIQIVKGVRIIDPLCRRLSL